MNLTEITMPNWVWLLLLIALLVGGIEPLVRWMPRVRGAFMFLASQYWMVNKSWPVKVVIEGDLTSQTVGGGVSVECTVILFSRESPVNVRDLKMMDISAGISSIATMGIDASDEDIKRWQNGFALEKGDSFYSRFIMPKPPKKVRVLIRANGRICQSRELTINQLTQ